MKIYLLNDKKFDGVINLCLNSFKFYEIKTDLNKFEALIITSKNALKALEKSKIPLNLNLQVYAVGQSSAKEALRLGFKKVKIPSKAYGDTLFDEFKDELKTQKCLYLRAKSIASNLNDLLVDYGVNLEQIIAYENVSKPLDKDFELFSPSVFIFVAPSSVRNFFKYFSLKDKDKIITIGERTAKSLKEFVGQKEILIPQIQSLEACVKLAKNL